jgi:hypothetical protein
VNADWFYSEGDTRHGPVTELELRRLAREGKLKASDLVWKDGMPDWVEARTVDALFPRQDPHPDAEDRPGRRRFDPDDRPTRRRRDDDGDDDRPSRRRDRYDEDEDRPRIRRTAGDLDGEDEYDRPRRRREEKPGQIQAVAIMMLVGSILGLLTMAGIVLGSMFMCCLWPGVYVEVVWAILALIRSINMLNQDDQGPPKTLAILQILSIINGDVINCILGIVCLVMLNDPQVQAYYRRKGFA